MFEYKLNGDFYMKRLAALLFALLLTVSCICVFTACGDDEGSTPPVYSVTLIDQDNKPIEGVIVTAFRNEEQMKMKRTNAEGKVTFDFTEGEYTFTLTFTGDITYKFDESKCVMNAENSAATLTLSKYVEPTYELYNGSFASIVTAGSYYTEFEAGETVYFIYTPSERGRYKISIDTEAKAICEYYGSPLIIYENDISNATDVERDADGNITGAIFADYRSYYIGETQFLYGVKATEAGSGYFTIEKVSDLEYIPNELPFKEYVKTHKINKEFAYSGGNLVNFDITNPTLKAAYNKNDGYYHLGSENGKIIYMKLTVSTAYTESLEKICETQPFQHYIYDEDGNFLDKVTYAPMMLEYFEAADETEGVYPLTEDLAVAIKNMGENLGWYKPAASGETHIIFGSDSVTANAWLFACCYEQN